MTNSAAGVRLADLARDAGASLDGDGDLLIERVGTLENASGGAIAFLANPKYRAQLATTRASAVIVSPEAAASTSLPKLVSGNPYATFAKVAALLHASARPPAGRHPTAVVDATAKIAASASIGPYATVGAGAIIGERAAIGAHCAVGADVTLGDDVLLHPHSTIYARCVVGARSVVHSGAVIGADGFGMAEEGGRWLKIPQVGRVVIGTDVEIGANTTIDRGAIDDTIIEDDVKLDNQIQIGHNCVIGTHTAIAGCTGIAGSTRIGRNCKIGGAAMINGHITIADGTVISAATPIIATIDRPGVYSGVWPQEPYGEWKRTASELRRLRSLAARVAALEHALAAFAEERPT
jgi:UDP-3-O-[3-hydroxymyristoyl] glucosamine N-acyltransferase